MGEYALITGTALNVTELYSQVVRREGLEAVVVRDSEEARRIVSARGKPKLVMADLEMSRDASFTLLREVQSSIPSADRPAVLASVSSELRTTARDLTDALGIAEVLPQGADARTLGSAVRRALTKERHRKADTFPASTYGETEHLRRSRLHAMGLLDGGSSENALQELVAEIADAFGMPIAVVSMRSEDAEWLETYVASSINLPESRRSLLDDTFCSYVVESGQPLIVQDASAHPTFATNPLVRSGVVASGAGMPLTTPEGDVLGAVCIFDNRPAAILPSFIDMLTRVARRIAAEFDLRSKARSSALEVIRFTEKLAQERETLHLARTSLSRLENVLAQLDGGVLVMNHERRIVYANRAASEFLDTSMGRLLGMTRTEFMRSCAKLVDDADGLLEKLVPRHASMSLCHDIELQRPVYRLLRWSCKAIELDEGIGQLTTLTELDVKKRARSSGRYPLVKSASKPKSSKKKS